MIDSYEDARGLVSDVVEEALSDRFQGSNVEVVDSATFVVKVEADDGAPYVLEIRVS